MNETNYNKLAETLLNFLQEIVNAGRQNGSITDPQALALERKAVDMFGIFPASPAQDKTKLRTWVAGVYNVGDTAIYGGTSYTCIVPTTIQEGPPPTETLYWKLTPVVTKPAPPPHPQPPKPIPAP
jgi:hypothetical protein